MSRRKARRLRRDLKRKLNKKEYTQKEVVTNQTLYTSFVASSKSVMFKESVQRYRLNVFFKNYDAKKRLLNNEDVRQGLIKFMRNDRGKPRFIQSLHFAERVIQKLICLEVLQPKFFKTLIKENTASQKGKGTLFASKLFEKHITQFLKRHKRGYILLIDFSKYFENLSHDVIIKFYNENISDPQLCKLCQSFVTVYDKGLGLGSEISQFNAIMYLNKIDHYIKSNFKYYGRYMDDSYIIHDNKEELAQFFEKLKKLYAEINIVINNKKTKIISLNQNFSFLKTRYKITESGKIIKKPCRTSITRERRRLKRQLKLLKNGVLQLSHIEISLASWRGSMVHRHARKSIYEIEKIYKNFLKYMEVKNNENALHLQ